MYYNVWQAKHLITHYEWQNLVQYVLRTWCLTSDRHSAMFYILRELHTILKEPVKKYQSLVIDSHTWNDIKMPLIDKYKTIIHAIHASQGGRGLSVSMHQCCWLRVTSVTVRAAASSVMSSNSCTASLGHSALPCECWPACDGTWYASLCRTASPAALASMISHTAPRPPAHTQTYTDRQDMTYTHIRAWQLRYRDKAYRLLMR